MPDDSIVEIKVALTAIARDLEHTSHRARNIEQKLDAFVLLRDLEPIELRISVLESSRRGHSAGSWRPSWLPWRGSCWSPKRGVLMPRQFETRALLALSVSALGVLGWWSLDRTPPVQQIENVAVSPVHAGEEAVIRSTVYRERRCYTELQRIVFDSAGVRTAFETQSFVSSGPLEQRDTFSQRLPIVSNAKPGQGASGSSSRGSAIRSTPFGRLWRPSKFPWRSCHERPERNNIHGRADLRPPRGVDHVVRLSAAAGAPQARALPVSRPPGVTLH
jgi:hypothetical protein